MCIIILCVSIPCLRLRFALFCIICTIIKKKMYDFMVPFIIYIKIIIKIIIKKKFRVFFFFYLSLEFPNLISIKGIELTP